MNDLISRQAAIDALNHEYRCGDIISQCGIEVAIDIISELPTIQPVATDTNVGDTISRQTAINTLCSKCTVDKPETCSTIQKGDNWCEEVYILQRVPSAQPDQKWIPVSERLPEEGGEYLTSVYHIVGPISVFHPENDTYVSDVAIMKFYDKFPSTVRAWMPLPEPYKEGGADVQ